MCRPTTGIGFEVEFTVAERHAAMLVLPHGAVRYDTKKCPEYEGYALQQAESWYRYVNQTRRRGARNGSLYLVTGCDKSRSWGLAAVSQLQEHSLMVKFSAGSLVQGTLGFHASWSRAGGVESRKYPPSNTETVQLENQCVFARGFVIGLRNNFFERKLAGTVRMRRVDSSRSKSFPTVSSTVPFGSLPGQSSSHASGLWSPPARDLVNESINDSLLDQEEDVVDSDDSGKSPSGIVQVYPHYPEQVFFFFLEKCINYSKASSDIESWFLYL